MTTLFDQHDIGIYFMSFLSLNQLKNYILVTKSTLAIFQGSHYYKEIKDFKLKYKKLVFSYICKDGNMNLFKLYYRDIDNNLTYVKN